MDYTRNSGGVKKHIELRVPRRLMDEVRRGLRVRHYSLRTEQAYTGWIRRFIIATGKRHPREVRGPEVEAFLSCLAADDDVALFPRSSCPA